MSRKKIEYMVVASEYGENLCLYLKHHHLRLQHLLNHCMRDDCYVKASGTTAGRD